MHRFASGLATCLIAFALGTHADADTVVGTGGVIPGSGSGGGGTWLAGFSATSLPSSPSGFSVIVPAAINGVNSITLTNLQHTYLGDCHLVLLSPDGAMYNVFVRPALFNPNDGHPGNFNGNYTFVTSGAPNNLPTSAVGANTSTNFASGNYNQTFGGSGAAGATWVNGNLGIYNIPLNTIKGPAGVWRLRMYDWAANDTGSLGSWTLNYTPVPPASPIVPAFIGGAVLINGSADSPDNPPSSATAPGQVTPLSATASGGTSSGLVGGTANLLVTIDPDVVTALHIFGQATSSQPAGYGGFAFIGITCNTVTFENAPLVVSLPRMMIFSINNQNVGATTSFIADTGQIVGNRLLPGTYLLDFSCGASVSKGQTQASQTLNWTLTLTPAVTPCGGDLNNDGSVNVTDLLGVIGAWGACPAPANCPADRNFDGTVNVTDLLQVIGTWGACP